MPTQPPQLSIPAWKQPLHIHTHTTPAPTPTPNTPSGHDSAGHHGEMIDYRGIDLAGQTWPEMELLRPNFANARLVDTALKKLRCEDGNFREADISGAVMSDGRFLRADFTEAVLEKADLSRTIFESHCLMDRCTMNEINAGSLRLTDAHAQEIRCRKAFLLYAHFDRTPLARSDFSYSNLQFAQFRGCDLTGCDFSNAYLVGAWFDARIEWDSPPNFAGANISNTEMPDKLRQVAEMTGAVVSK